MVVTRRNENADKVVNFVKVFVLTLKIPINTISSRLAMRIKKNINYVYQVDPITNPLNKHHRNCLENSKNNYHWDLGSRRVN